MTHLCNDQLIGIYESSIQGVWRVICRDYERQSTVLARTPFALDGTTAFDLAEIPRLRIELYWITDDELAALQYGQMAIEIEDFDLGSKVAPSKCLSDAAQAKAQFRQQVMAAFLSPDKRARALAEDSDFSRLVRNARETAEHMGGRLSNVTIYRLLKLLICLGFRGESLNPMFHRRGAPGTARPYGANDGRKRPGRRSDAERAGVATFETQCIPVEMRTSIIAYARALDHTGRSERSLYDEVLKRFYVRRLGAGDHEVKLLLAAPGAYPNFYQFRNFYRKEIKTIERLQLRTSTSHFRRNHRALTGTARDGVLGPGHRYAIDSTAANIYLRSGLDRSLYVGRPVVYWVIDTWSTAIVGYYVCLSAPSWRNAKTALFCVAASQLVSRFGLDYHVGLNPLPTLPAMLLSDRGEYLSEGATETALAVGYTVSYNPSYRPDLRGLGEQVHRITQEMQFGFVPGTFDVRKKELELNSARYQDSRLTVAEYVAYLSNIVEIYNKTSDRKYIAPIHSTLDGVDMTPAGLWGWGHAVGLGYRSRCTIDDACRNLLISETFTCRAGGLFFQGARYQSEDLPPELALIARNSGRVQLNGYMLPSAIQTAFVSAPGYTNGLVQVGLASGQRIGETVSLFDWQDALAYQNCHARHTRGDLDQIRLGYLAKNEQIVRDAQRATPEYTNKPPALSVSEARRLETEGMTSATPPSTPDIPARDTEFENVVYHLLGGV